MTIPVAIAIFVLDIVALAAIRYESLRKDVQRNKQDLGGVAGIARAARDEGHRMEIMTFYLALSVCPEDPVRREKVMAAMFEAATRKRS
jgi:hypothetical protein